MVHPLAYPGVPIHGYLTLHVDNHMRQSLSCSLNAKVVSENKSIRVWRHGKYVNCTQVVATNGYQKKKHLQATIIMCEFVFLTPSLGKLGMKCSNTNPFNYPIQSQNPTCALGNPVRVHPYALAGQGQPDSINLGRASKRCATPGQKAP